MQVTLLFSHFLLLRVNLVPIAIIFTEVRFILKINDQQLLMFLSYNVAGYFGNWAGNMADGLK